MPAGENSVAVWYRRDLRTADHAALRMAAATGRPVLPVFVLGDEESGGAARWWLHHSLQALRDELAALELPLVLLRGNAPEILPEWADRHGIDSIHCHRSYEPPAVQRDDETAAALRTRGLQLHYHEGALITGPESLRTGQGGPYQVFTPYSKAFTDRVVIEPPATVPAAVRAAADPGDGLPLAALDLLPRTDWAAGLRGLWRPGSEGAATNLQRFLADAVNRYDADRNRPHRDGTSRLSPHLHFGEISPRQVWHASKATRSAGPFLRQIIWREFAHHLLHYFPHTVDRPLRPAFDAFPWDGDPNLFSAWQQGETGYPLVDAGMRQLWHTGWMHNRVRMVVASFLVKHLLLPWQTGADWFADTLVDSDLANNTFGWQWTAGCGADAAPYFRIFNPTLQGRKFDPEGEYVRRWVPELAKLPKRWIHEPAAASPMDLAGAGIVLGRDYPHPIVEHRTARERALESYRRMQAG